MEAIHILTFGEGGFTMRDVLDMTYREIDWHCRRYAKQWKAMERAAKGK